MLKKKKQLVIDQIDTGDKKGKNIKSLKKFEF